MKLCVIGKDGSYRDTTIFFSLRVCKNNITFYLVNIYESWYEFSMPELHAHEYTARLHQVTVLMHGYCCCRVWVRLWVTTAGFAWRVFSGISPFLFHPFISSLTTPASDSTGVYTKRILLYHTCFLHALLSTSGCSLRRVIWYSF